MKKLLAVVLAAVMVLSLGVVSFAAKGDVLDDMTGVASYTPSLDMEITEADVVYDDGITQALNATSNIASDNTFYIPMTAFDTITLENGGAVSAGTAAVIQAALADSDITTFSKKYEEGGKAVASIKRDEYKINGVRTDAIEIALKEDLTDEETKVEVELRFNFRKNVSMNLANSSAIEKGTKATATLVFYVENGEMRLDDTATVGTSGVYAKAEKNEDNSLEWEDNNNTIAKLEFSANDDPDAFYPRMTTSWELAIGDTINNKNFEGTDAVVRAFRAAPVEIPCTSRASFYLYMPAEFGDDVDPADVAIYEVKDNEFVDVTSKFEYVETDEDGNDVDGFLTRTRTLGVYVICEKAVEETALVDGTPVPEKENPGTGR
ncbi:hypothetical protein [Youxingia wuxianensis]|uniref:Uncharacterized protein n=1 Tax=Youxingia wuxianensis TaxID=2763678 RepID=A0A926IDM7_9FIRM|nr:hypothetical protein [Youxingia wuxianensis]MBC8586467.1 hypothetical protein [Youxingia wuxianensis]